MRSVMTHEFSRAPQADVPRSRFDRSQGYKTTFDAGYLIPFYVDEALPGDVFRVNVTAFARLATALFPVMDNAYMSFFFFSVANRLLWENWKKFCGEQDDPGDSIDFTIPVVSGATNANTGTGTLWDYFGLPIDLVPDNHAVSCLPYRAYWFTWDEWFRDQNLQDGRNYGISNSSFVLGSASGSPARRGKRHDYFTSCLPWPQKGDSVDLPLGTTAPVQGIGAYGANVANAQSTTETGGATQTYSHRAANFIVEAAAAGPSEEPAIYADLSNATAATINQLRQAFQIQKLLERDARGGTRYAEVILSHFGVEFQDVRYRPEYLGGGRVPVNLSPIPNNSGSSGNLGDLGAIGVASATNIGFTKAFDEHSTIIGLVCVDADLTYQKGIDRMWLRSTRYDFYWPALAHIGEQAVTNEEIYAQGTADDDLVFGYQERYAEYRYGMSKITGLFRSDATGTLDAWHWSQDFSTLPTLGDTFIQSTPPIDRTIADATEPHFIFDAFINANCARPMPLYGIPGMIDHF